MQPGETPQIEDANLHPALLMLLGNLVTRVGNLEDRHIGMTVIAFLFIGLFFGLLIGHYAL